MWDNSGNYTPILEEAFIDKSLVTPILYGTAGETTTYTSNDTNTYTFNSRVSFSSTSREAPFIEKLKEKEDLDFLKNIG